MTAAPRALGCVELLLIHLGVEASAAPSLVTDLLKLFSVWFEHDLIRPESRGPSSVLFLGEF